MSELIVEWDRLGSLNLLQGRKHERDSYLKTRNLQATNWSMRPTHFTLQLLQDRSNNGGNERLRSLPRVAESVTSCTERTVNQIRRRFRESLKSSAKRRQVESQTYLQRGHVGHGSMRLNGFQLVQAPVQLFHRLHRQFHVVLLWKPGNREHFSCQW